MAVLRSLYLLLSASANLLFIAEVTRHGARAPSKLYPFNAEFWKEPQLKQLTEIGLRQHFELGNSLREKYTSIFDKYDTRTIDILSSPSPRAVLSAYAHLAGLYPDGPTWFQKYNGSGDPKKVYVELPEFPSDTPVKIAKGKELHAVKGHKEFVCPKMKKLKKDMEESEEYKHEEDLLKTTLFPELSKELQIEINSILDVNSIASALYCEEAAGNQVKMPNKELLDKANAVRTFKINHVPYSSNEAKSLSSAGFFERLTGQIEGVFNKSGLKYAYYSAHDYTLLSFLNSLGSTKKFMPNFAASLIFEVYEDRSIHIKYEQTHLEMEISRNGIVDWEEFKKLMMKHSFEDLEKACRVA